MAADEPASELPGRIADEVLDPDATLRDRIVRFVEQGDFGLASGSRADGDYDRVWYKTPVDAEEVAFETDVYLLTPTRAEALQPKLEPKPTPPIPPPTPPVPPDPPTPPAQPHPSTQTTVRISGEVPSEVWNRIGITVLPKLKSADDVTLAIDLSGIVESGQSEALKSQLKQAIDDLGLGETVRIDSVPES